MSSKEDRHTQGDQSFKYEGWNVLENRSTGTCIANRTILGAANHSDKLENKAENIALHLTPSNDISYEGSWPHPNVATEMAPKTILTGSCLYSDCWKVHFAAHSPKQAPPRPLILGLEGDREKIVKYLLRGRTIVHLDIPTKLCLYQEKLLAWQVACVAEMPTVETVRYHLPVSVYHKFVDEFEMACAKQLPFMHFMLSRYADMYRQRVREAFAKIGHSVVFCDPTHDRDGSILDAHGSDQAPYLDAALNNEEGVMGLEDLAQLSISVMVAKKTGVVIPCRVGVLGLPHPIKTCGGKRCQCVKIHGRGLDLRLCKSARGKTFAGSIFGKMHLRQRA